MIGITKRMEKTGFIIRKNDQNDDRFKWLEITPKGQQVLKSISGIVQSFHDLQLSPKRLSGMVTPSL